MLIVEKSNLYAYTLISKIAAYHIYCMHARVRVRV